MNLETVVALAGLASGLIATYVKLANEVTQLRSRIHTLEQSDGRTQEKLDLMLAAIQELKILLAKKGLD